MKDLKGAYSRGFAAVGCVLCLALLAGCSAGTAAAGGAAQRASSSCPPPGALTLFGAQPGPPKPLAAPLDAALLARFDLFRRSIVPGDMPPAKDLAGGRLARELSRDYELASYYPGYIRRLTMHPGGQTDYVVPAFARPEALPPARCMPARARRELIAQRHLAAVEPVYCLIAPAGTGDAPTGCSPFAAVDEQVEIFLSGASRTPILKLVPDGVTSVRISYRARAPIVVPVSDNALLFTPPPPGRRVTAARDRLSRLPADSSFCVHSDRGGWRCSGPHLTKAQRLRRKRALTAYRRAVAASGPTKIDWLDAAGGAMRTIATPTARQVAATWVDVPRAPIGG